MLNQKEDPRSFDQESQDEAREDCRREGRGIPWLTKMSVKLVLSRGNEHGNDVPFVYDHGFCAGGHTNVGFTTDDLAKASEKKKESNGKIDNPWEVADLTTEDDVKWGDMSTCDKIQRVLINTAKVALVIGFLYLFICSLDFLASAFRLIAGRTTGDIMNNQYIQNPVVGLMIGILVTVLVQSSSTSTSIIVSMVSADILQVHNAIPMIMGSNIGTSVTNTIVSLTQVGDRNEFRRAFAGATVHDMFNWMAVITMLIIEIATGMLESLTGAIVSSGALSQGGGEVKILKVITEPFTKLVVQLNKKVLTHWSAGGCLENSTTLIKTSCAKKLTTSEATSTAVTQTTTVTSLTTTAGTIESCVKESDGTCKFLFYDTPLTDTQIGIILLIVSLVILCTALIIIVKILNSMMKGKMAVIIKKTINAEIPYVPWLTGYIAILVGAFMTFIVQSSSIFTSTLTPLIGIGVISIERSYPLTLGSNIGTTTTALLASMAGSGPTLSDAIQIALVHLFFNIFGIMLFYPIPFMRFPIPLAKKLGEPLPSGPLVMGVVGIPIVAIFVLAVIINIIQAKKRSILPKFLQTWDWLPKPLHSLQPYDACCLSLPCCKSCREVEDEELDHVEVKKENKDNSVENQAFENTDTKF
ncbi:Sodium-dependent phosphate transport protein 2A [Chionoecetes opilio]|uniref:Sodium-dependent phosphate transport protein 2A n=1 Tax=Chionoecetes opilio TaxID=41210 RepID=A0A8J4XUB9_CHIOP|nr:Sodium-dependent phosphate transport protein 2A [Chionoecetes opilio]